MKTWLHERKHIRLSLVITCCVAVDTVCTVLEAELH